MNASKPKTRKPSLDLDAVKAELRLLTTDELHAIYNECVEKTAEYTLRAAVALVFIEERTKKKFVGVPYAGIYRKIAAGQILPELACEFIASPGKVDIFYAPPEVQQRLAKEPTVPVAEPTQNGGFTTRMIDLRKAPRETVRQVVGDDGIRTPEEQIAYIKTERRPPVAPPAPRYIDENNTDEPLKYSVTGKVTATEYKAIRIMAAEQGLTLAQVVRRLLLRSGALEPTKVKRRSAVC